MTYTLLDGTDIEFHILTPAGAATVTSAISDEGTMFVEVIRLAVANPQKVLNHIADLADPVGQRALLGTEILVASMQVHARLTRLSATRIQEDE